MAVVAPDVIVVGAGAAGIFASLRAAQHGAKVLLLEKTSRIGTKILISGGGKCNIAHDGPIEEVLRAFRQNEAVFLRPSVYRLPNTDIIDLFVSQGLEVYTRPDGRVFPVHQTAKDVVRILMNLLEDAGVILSLESPATEILTDGGRVVGVKTGKGSGSGGGVVKQGQFGVKALLTEVLANEAHEGISMANRTIFCPNVVVCVGGSSYPNSGTTGDGYPWMKQLGHSLVKVRGALAPLYLDTDPAPPAERSGVALRGVLLKARSKGKEVARWQNDLLFTHKGVSGPSVLGISRVVAERMELGPVELFVDLAPGESAEQLQDSFQREAVSKPRIFIKSWLDGLLPASLMADFLTDAKLLGETPLGQVAKKDRNRLVETIKAWSIGTVRSVPIEKGECVAGGVPLEEVDPKTMRSKVMPGLYLCGEILDIAGPVGGYNLQAAFATGFVAGETAALDALAPEGS